MMSLILKPDQLRIKLDQLRKKVSNLITDDPANFQWSSLFCPVPVSEYLTKASVNSNAYNASGTSIYQADGAFVTTKTYDALTGVLSVFQCKVKNQVLFEYDLGLTIPGYPVPLFLGVSVASMIGIAWGKNKF